MRWWGSERFRLRPIQASPGRARLTLPTGAVSPFRHRCGGLSHLGIDYLAADRSSLKSPSRVAAGIRCGMGGGNGERQNRPRGYPFIHKTHTGRGRSLPGYRPPAPGHGRGRANKTAPNSVVGPCSPVRRFGGDVPGTFIRSSSAGLSSALAGQASVTSRADFLLLKVNDLFSFLCSFGYSVWAFARCRRVGAYTTHVFVMIFIAPRI